MSTSSFESISPILRMVAQASMASPVENDGFDPQAPQCAACGDQRFYLLDGELLRCECADSMEERALGWIERRRAAGIEAAEFRNMRFDTFRTDGDQATMALPVDLVLGWLTEPTACLLIAGPSGSGVTHLMVSIIDHALGEGAGGAYWRIPELMDALRRSNSPSAGDDAHYRFMDELLTMALLALDDLGAERRNQFVDEKTAQIVAGRYKHGLPTVIGTHLLPDILRAQYPALASRLLANPEHGARRIILEGPDYRCGHYELVGGVCRGCGYQWGAV